MNTELSTAPLSSITKQSPPGVYDPNVFQQLVAISAQMAHTSLIPDTLTKDKTGTFPIEKVQANCFLIAEQAHRWGMSPFAVAQAASVVYGRLMWEGKLVAAVIDQNAGIRLNYEYTGNGESRTVTVIGQYPDEDKPRTVSGSVADWKTDQWKRQDYDQRLSYRGAREWARRHCPGVMLGVVTADEADDYELRDVTPRTVTRTESDIAPSFEKPSAQSQTAETQPESKTEETAPATDAVAAHVVSATESGDVWLVVLRGSEKEIATTAENSEIGKRANQLTGLPCLVIVKKRQGKIVLTSIQLKEEEGPLL